MYKLQYTIGLAVIIFLNFFSYSNAQQCSFTQFYDDFNKTCYDCVFPCVTCQGQYLCTSCYVNYFLLQTNGSCVSNCGFNYYQDNSTQTCGQCSSTCISCTGPSSSDCLEEDDSSNYIQILLGIFNGFAFLIIFMIVSWMVFQKAKTVMLEKKEEEILRISLKQLEKEANIQSQTDIQIDNN